MSMENPANVIACERNTAAYFIREAEAAEREGDPGRRAQEYRACAELARKQADRLENAA